MLRFFDVSVLASASMGPAYSLAATMGPMVATAGAAAPVALLAVSAIMLCVAIAFAQLSRVAPNAGSSYSWIRMAFGGRIGAYGAWLLLLSNFFATMATAVPAGIYTLDLLAPRYAQNPLADAGVGAIWILGSAVLLYVGIRPTALVTAIALAIELSVLAASAIVAALSPHHAVIAHAPQSAHVSLFALTFFGFVNAMTLGIWMSDGWEVSASAAEEVRDDARASGRGGVTGLIATTVVLCLCMIGYLHLGSVAGFSENQDDSMRYVGDLLGGGAWRFAIVATVLVSTCSALWTTILYLSRSVYAMGRDGLLPPALGKLDARDEPLASLAAVAVLAAAFELATGFSPTAADALQTVLNASSIFLGLLFALSAAAAIRTFLRKRESRLAGVVIPAIGLVALALVLTATILLEDRVLQYYAAGGVVLGIPFALWRGGRRLAPAGELPGGYE
ncbi:MAG TPA: APC family permease [Candidatus Baltobacteraceae bacterium]